MDTAAPKGIGALNTRESQPVNTQDYNTANAKHCIRENGTGGWSSAFLLLVNQGLATLAFFGVGVNLVLFLTRVLGQDNASAANNVSKWTGTVYLCSLVGAFLSDSYWGRYLTCAVFQVIFVLGLVLLSVSSWLLLLKPAGCGDGKQICVPATSFSSALFYLAVYLVAFGYGGHQPTIATFGADQFDESNPRQRNSKSSFFCYFYFALNTGSLFSNTILVYYEDSGEWTLGFWAATASAVLALVAYLLGSKGYRYIKPSGNPVRRVMQVFIAAAKKWDVKMQEGETLHEVEGSESAIKGSRKIFHTDGFECLDKAAIITDQDRQGPADPWRLCTVTQVEEAKCILRMLPIWLCTIIYSVVFTQMASLFVEQGNVMNSTVGNFHLPPASMSAFDICSVLLCTGIYRQILVPIAGRLSGNPKGLTELQHGHRPYHWNAGNGRRRRNRKGKTQKSHPRRARQPDEHILADPAAPDGVKSLGSSLCMASMSLGNFVSSLLVNMVMGITARNNNPGWIPADLNTGHMDMFYFLIAGLTAADLVVYVACAKWYKCINLEVTDGDHEVGKAKDAGEREEEMVNRV
ncbi:UNVERIFIED_CONTAM: protein NRT1/ PTR FAMILY 7.1 [Sesamum calycinum]|uniref:Protein NRT1/ PTR FAMILY 7.1 n=1 Tax=Sesamum calycinum TaxID=2727403 RepID=A0AAW2SA70_9LAMI